MNQKEIKKTTLLNLLCRAIYVYGHVHLMQGRHGHVTTWARDVAMEEEEEDCFVFVFVFSLRTQGGRRVAMKSQGAHRWRREANTQLGKSQKQTTPMTKRTPGLRLRPDSDSNSTTDPSRQGGGDEEKRRLRRRRRRQQRAAMDVSRRNKWVAWVAAVTIFVVLMLVTPAIPQNEEYHDFADQRRLFLGTPQTSPPSPPQT